MIKNIWSTITVECMNHDSPEGMEILQNTELIKTPFYRCKDAKCANRLNLDDYEDLITHFLHKIEEHPFDNLSNMTFGFRGHRHSYDIKVIRYKEGDIRLGIINKTVLGKNA